MVLVGLLWKCKKYREKEVENLFFNEILALQLEGFMEFIISGYLNYKKDYLYSTAWGESISVIVGYVPSKWAAGGR